MTAIVLKEFYGVMPSVDVRRLPLGHSVQAENLHLDYGDFRPRQQDSNTGTAVTPGVKTIYRTPDSGTWLSSMTDVYYARGQLIGAENERIYLTGRSAYPESWQSGSYRRLGVPAPSAAPVISVTTRYDPYIASEREDDIEINLIGGIENAVLTSLVPIQWLGAADSHGMQQLTEANGFSQDNPAQLVYGQAMSGGVIVDSQNKGWLLDPRLDGFVNATSTFYCVPIHAYGYWTQPDQGVLATKMAAFYRPRGPASGDQLFTTAQINSFVAAAAEYFDPDDEWMQAQKGRLTALVDAFHRLVSTGYDPIMADAVTDFYAKSAVAAEIDAAVTNAANRVLDQLYAAATYNPTTEFGE